MRVLFGLAGALVAATAGATSFKWASASDIPTWDIHSQNNALANGVHAAVYESLFYYNRKFELEPMLATSFKQMGPTQVRITLRQGVKFHDGAAFNADDAKFSLERAMSKTSNYG
ncbi:MAG: ABC transporter substrate-binding protein, partial [Burkholderiaceae bacterium]